MRLAKTSLGAASRRGEPQRWPGRPATGKPRRWPFGTSRPKQASGVGSRTSAEAASVEAPGSGRGLTAPVGPYGSYRGEPVVSLRVPSDGRSRPPFPGGVLPHRPEARRPRDEMSFPPARRQAFRPGRFTVEFRPGWPCGPRASGPLRKRLSSFDTRQPLPFGWRFLPASRRSGPVSPEDPSMRRSVSNSLPCGAP